MSRPVPSEAVVAAARALKGVPFRHQGRTPAGLDCLGLAALAFRAAGLDVRDRANYGRDPDLRQMKEELDGRLIRMRRGSPLAPGCLGMFFDAGWLHVGIITPLGLVHARGPEGVGPGVVEHLIDEQSWNPRLKVLWRHPRMAWEA